MSICQCGMEHKHDIKNIVVGKDALASLVTIVEKEGFKNIILVADINTYPLAGEKVKSLLPSVNIKEYIFQDEELIPDEDAIGKLLIASGGGYDLMLTIGSGTLNDMSRYISARTGIPYIIIATAPSMDGYASMVSPLIVGDLKITYDAVVAHSIIGDTDIMRTAPLHMVGAGLGDMLGKFNAKCDWQLATLIEGDYYCDYVVKLVEEAVATCIRHSDGMKARDEQTVKSIMDGLILSGVAMSYTNSSRPASGAEHYLAHFWEVMFLLEGKKAVLHGTKVGIGSIVMEKLHDMFMKEKPDWDRVRKNAESYTFEKFKENMERIYKQASPSIIEEEILIKRSGYENTIKRIDMYEKNWDAIRKIVETTKKDFNYLKELLEKSDSPTSPQQIGVDRQMFINSILYAKELRKIKRYSILQMLGDLGLLEEYAEKLADEYYK